MNITQSGVLVFFLHDLDEKMTTAGYKREQNKKTEQDGTTEPFGAQTKSFPVDNFSTLEAATGPKLISVSLQSSQLSSPKDFAPSLSK